MEVMEIGPHFFPVFVARVCEHIVHAAHTSNKYTLPLCPVCHLRLLVQNVRGKQESFAERGGIFQSKAFPSENLEDKKHGSMDDKRTENGPQGHRKLLRGYSESKRKMKLERKRGEVEEDPEAAGWRRAKTMLANYIQKLEMMAQTEKIWEREKGFGPGGDDRPTWLEYSAQKAQKVFEEEEDSILRVAGEPAGGASCPFTNAVWLRSIAQDADSVTVHGHRSLEQTDQESISQAVYVTGYPPGEARDALLKCRTTLTSNEEEKDEDVELQDGRRKRRRTSATVTFSEPVTVYGLHEVQCVYPLHTTWQNISLKLKRKPRSQPSTQPLTHGPGRARRCFWRPSSGRPEGYVAGTWASPEGYEKVETSWRHTKDNDIEQHWREEEEMARVPNGEPSGAYKFLVGVAGSVFALRIFFGLCR